MRKILVIIGSGLIFNGCALSKKTYLPDGSMGYSIDCSGAVGTWGMCETKAGQLCKEKGYEIISRAGDQGTITSGSTTSIFSGTVTSRTLLIKCK